MVDKEILWEKIVELQFLNIIDSIEQCTKLITHGIHFATQNLRFNIKHDNSDFDKLLEKKFSIVDPYSNVPCLYCVQYNKSFGFELPYRNYGYIAPDEKHAIVLASSFGVIKSVISGFASFIVEKLGYRPTHASVLATKQKGVIFSGGCMAGKTTTLINLVDSLLKNNVPVGILTDDWAVVQKRHGNYTAETFDRSVSLRKSTILENPHIKFHQHNNVIQAIHQQTKISVPPEQLYLSTRNITKVGVDTIVILNPEPGKNELQTISAKKFAQAMIDAAYHYPYVSKEQVQRHYNFWVESTKEIRVFKFATRPQSGEFQNLEPLWRLVT